MEDLDLQKDRDQVDLSSLPSGFYLLIRRTENGPPEYAKVNME
jgi:hypothetical protein